MSLLRVQDVATRLRVDTMRIAALADLHGHFPPVEALGDADVVVIAGDIVNHPVHLDEKRQGYHLRQQYLNFQRWCDKVWAAGIHIVGVAGNHDFAFQQIPEMPYKFKWLYLEDSGWEHEGVKFWGSPWQPWMSWWAFNSPESDLDDEKEPFLDEKFQKIPADTDVLITHSPPAGFGDLVKGAHKGSIALSRHVERVLPTLHVFGHIHKPEVFQVEGVTLCNASYVGSSTANP
jgi:Icc-related predicted phosphoesterase